MRRSVLAAALALVAVLAVAVPASAQTPAPSPSPSSAQPSCNTACAVKGFIGAALATTPLAPLAGPAGAVAGGVAGFPGNVASSALEGLTAAFVSSAVAVLRKIVTSLNDNASIDLGAPWFLTHYGIMLSLSVLLLLYGSIMAASRAALFGAEGDVLKVFWRALGSAVLMSGPVLIVVAMGLQVTDWATEFVLRSSGVGIGTGLLAFGDRLQAATSPVAGIPGMGLALLTVLAIAAFFGALLIWIALLVRMAVVFIAVSFLPMAYAGKPHPSFDGTAKKLGHLIAGAVVAKFILAAIIALAVAWFSSGDTTDIGHDLAFGIVLLLAPLAPWKLISKVGSVFAAGGAAGAGARPAAAVRKTASGVRSTRMLAFARTGRHEGVVRPSRAGRTGAGARPAPAGASSTTTYRHSPKPGEPARPVSQTRTHWGPGGHSSVTQRFRRDGTPATTTWHTSTGPPPKRKPATAPRQSARKPSPPKRSNP